MNTNDLVALKQALPLLASGRRNFAESLLNQSKRKALSPAQAEWVVKLVAEASAPKPEAVAVGDMTGLIALFGKAAAKLKHPKIRLALPAGDPVVLSVAGPASKNPGSINITDGGPYGANVWYGRVDALGCWHPSKAGLNASAALVPLLVAMALEPAKVAGEHGRLFGQCCFCGRGLEDKRSTEVGYGPICAANYNLPWGA